MKWQTAVNTELYEVESRWAGVRRQLRRLLLALLLAGLLSFLTLHPYGHGIVRTGQGIGQAGWWAATTGVERLLGPAWFLRQHGQWSHRQLEQALVGLAALEEESSEQLTAWRGQLPALLQAEEAAYQAVQALTQTPPGAADWAATLARYQAVHTKVGQAQEMVRRLSATVAQARALRRELQAQQAALALTLQLFAQRLTDGDAPPALQAEELNIVRSTLETQVAQARVLRRAGRELADGSPLRPEGTELQNNAP